MPIGSISIYSLLAVSKIGVKIAERKKWMPAGYYHRLSLQKLKQGDLRGAEKFNITALHKNPDDEGVLVVRDLIAMRRDVDAREIMNRIIAEEEQIIQLQDRKKQNRLRIRRIAKSEKWHRILLIFLAVAFTGIPGLVFYLAPSDSNAGLKVTALAVAGFLLSLLLIYSKTIGEKKHIVRKTFVQELQATLATFEHEMSTRKKRIQRYKEKFRDMGHHQITKAEMR